MIEVVSTLTYWHIYIYIYINTRCIHVVHHKNHLKLPQSRNFNIQETEWPVKAMIQSYIEHKKINISSIVVYLSPSNVQLLHSFQIVRISHKEIAFHNTAISISMSTELPLPTCQHINYLWGITHCTPKRQNTRDQKTLAILQYKSRWSSDYPHSYTCNTTPLQLYSFILSYPS